MVLFAVISYLVVCFLSTTFICDNHIIPPLTLPVTSFIYTNYCLKSDFVMNIAVLGGVMVYQLASGIVDRGFEPKNMKLVSFASPLSTPH